MAETAHSRGTEIGIAVVLDAGEVMVTARRGAVHLADFDEFPGGVRESGESLEDCVRREVREEVGLDVAIVRELASVDHQYPDRHVELHFFECRLRDARPARFELQTHSPRWIRLDRLCDLHFPPANAPVVAQLIARHRRS